MTGTLVMIVVGAGCAAAGAWCLLGGFTQPATSLAAAARHLHRAPLAGTTRRAQLGERLVRAMSTGRTSGQVGDLAADLALVGRSAEVHATLLAAALLAGLVAPPLLCVVAIAAGVGSAAWFVPLGASVVGALALPLAVHADLRARARQARRDLRHQLSALLDVTTMLLAGNVGNEGALRHAASAGDGRLFVELRRRMTESEAAGRSVVDALAVLGDELRIVELQQIAASASLASSEGAPVARSLAAKCATLRSTLASEDEAAGRIRTGKLSLPLVGMGIVIMALVMYPALNVT